MTEMIRAHFPLTPKGIIDHLRLRRPIYRATAAFGHFGRSEDSFLRGKSPIKPKNCGQEAPVAEAA